MGLEFVEELVRIVGQSPNCVARYLSKSPHSKNGTNTGRLQRFGYTNMRSTWIHHNLSSNHNRERLQIVKLLLVYLSIRFKQRRRYECYAKAYEKGLIETTCLRAAFASEQIWTKALYVHSQEFLWCSCCLQISFLLQQVYNSAR